MSPSLLLAAFSALCLGTFPIFAEEGGTRADYNRARELGRRFEGKIVRDRFQPHWLPNNTRFWYEVRTGAGSSEFILVDAESGIRRPAFDQPRLMEKMAGLGINEPGRLENLRFVGEAIEFRAGGKNWHCELSTYELQELASVPVIAPLEDDVPLASKRTGPETSLHFINRTTATVELFWIDSDGARQTYGKLAPGQEREQHTFAGHVWLAANEAGKPIARFAAQEAAATAEIVPPSPKSAPPRETRHRTPARREISPDGQWRASIRDYNLILTNTETERETALTTDGSAQAAYDEHLVWSPDSTKVVALRTESGTDRKVYVVESSPKDQLQPRLHSYDYPKPGDPVPVSKPHLFEMAHLKEVPIDDALFRNPWSLGDVRWEHDSSRFTFLYNQRGHQVLRIVAVDAATGEARAIVDESSQTFICYSGKSFHETIEETGEIIWMSERDGWNHLYLYDGKSGQVKNQITKGEWVVREVDRVDREARQIWFRAGGVYPDQDPYYLHLCRVNFDGSGFTLLTEGDGTHAVEFSPDRRFFIDRYSRVDLAPVTELRSSADGHLLCKLETASLAPLIEAGWRAPERFVAKGRDGVTDIYGIINRPTTFDPNRKYPVIENIYAGPQDSFVPKSFSTLNRMQELAELGFIVVQIDGMGTSNRSKKFHDVCWQNLADAGFPDRILWMQAAAAREPAMDLTRVGIYGTSAGGQNALGGLLLHGDFYKAGIADCGCHDNRMDKIWWNEQWMGWPIGAHYSQQSNVTLAPKLQGKLLLMVGELDKNVDPASTMQVVDALIKADKDFELLVVPGAGHGVSGASYGRRRLQDFFVKTLLAVEPRR
ncbi:MAG: dap4 3 [Chthoniobacteraceae bacterium]|nr:dap4 3 [Chthoniobacteraceae bacterium]